MQSVPLYRLCYVIFTLTEEKTTSPPASSQSPGQLDKEPSSLPSPVQQGDGEPGPAVTASEEVTEAAVPSAATMTAMLTQSSEMSPMTAQLLGNSF